MRKNSFQSQSHLENNSGNSDKYPPICYSDERVNEVDRFQWVVISVNCRYTRIHLIHRKHFILQSNWFSALRAFKFLRQI